METLVFLMILATKDSCQYPQKILAFFCLVCVVLQYRPCDQAAIWPGATLYVYELSSKVRMLCKIAICRIKVTLRIKKDYTISSHLPIRI